MVNAREVEVQNARAEVDKWLKKFNFLRYVDSGYEQELEGIPKNCVWTEWEDGLNGEWAVNELNPGDDSRVPQGYYVMEKPYEAEEGTLFVTTTLVFECEDCDGSDECEFCEGQGSIYEQLN